MNIIELVLAVLIGQLADFAAGLLITGRWQRYTPLDWTTYGVQALAVGIIYSGGLDPWASIAVFLLLVSWVTDLRYLLLSRWVTLAPIPGVLALRLAGQIPGGLGDGLMGMAACGGFLYTIGALFAYRHGREGIGQGDVDLACFTGAYLGLYYGWIALTGAAVGGVMIHTLLCLIRVISWHAAIPFGTYLATAALVVFRWLL